MLSRFTRLATRVLLLVVLILTLRDTSYAVILFRANPNGQTDFYLMNDDGKHVRQLTRTPFSEYNPLWSPDGKYILFRRNLGPTERNPHAQQFDIFIMDADGSNERRLTFHPLNDVSPCWSPDGKQIAFSGIRDGMPNIQIMDLETGNIRQLTKSKEGELFSSMPTWSPDGQHIVYQLVTDVGRQLYITDINGKKTRPFLQGAQPPIIGDTVISKSAPRWSSNGKHLLYFENRVRYEPNRIVRLANSFIVVDKNGSNPKRLDIPENWWLYSASWAANDTEILFSAEKTWGLPVNQRKYNIYRYQLANGKITQLTNTPTKDLEPHWLPGTLSISPKDKLKIQWSDIKMKK